LWPGFKGWGGVHCVTVRIAEGEGGGQRSPGNNIGRRWTAMDADGEGRKT
jgi:hypothetical protein